MNVPDAAIEAAAEAITCEFCKHSAAYYKITARAAIEAAMPAIREAIAQEIEAADLYPNDLPRLSYSEAARIVRDEQLKMQDETITIVAATRDEYARRLAGCHRLNQDLISEKISFLPKEGT